MEGWIIDRDYLDCGRKGYGQVDRGQVLAEFDQVIARRITVERDLRVADLTDPVRWRALDEDGEIHYGGAVTSEWLLGADDLAYSICNFTEADTGATIVQFRAKDLPEKMVTRHREIGCTDTDNGTEWVTIYG